MQVERRKLRAKELRQAAAQDAVVVLPVAALEQR